MYMYTCIWYIYICIYIYIYIHAYVQGLQTLAIEVGSNTDVDDEEAAEMARSGKAGGKGGGKKTVAGGDKKNKGKGGRGR